MKVHAYLECIDPSHREKRDIHTTEFTCSENHLCDVRYDGSFNAKDLIKLFLRRTKSDGNIFDESGVWRFRELLNFVGMDSENYNEYKNLLVSLDGGEGRTRPYMMSKVAKDYVGMNPEKLWLQPEGLNPSGSFKDNGMVAAFTHGRMVGAKVYICASTGNTSASAAEVGANEGMRTIVVVPKGIAPGKLSQAYQFGAEVKEIDGNFDYGLKLVIEKAKNEGIYMVNSINPFRAEGQKTMMYRGLELFNWEAPDWIVWPGGALGNAASFGKSLDELYRWGLIKRKPRVAVVNAEGANTLYTLYNGLYKNTELRWNGGNVDYDLINDYYKHLDNEQIKPTSIASAINILKPLNIPKALRTLDEFGGVVTQVPDNELLDAMAIVGMNGFDCELASAATVAGIKRLVEEEVIAKDDKVFGILTGRSKDPKTMVEYHHNPKNRFANPPKEFVNS